MQHQPGVAAATVGAFILVLLLLIVLRIPSSPFVDPIDTLKSLTAPSIPSDEYTYVPRPLSRETLLQLYPPHLRLASLQVVHRHGERTPVAANLPDLEQNRNGWNLCRTPEVREEFFLQPRESTLFRHGSLGADGQPVNLTPGRCGFGQLTDKGKRSMHRVGMYLRWLYIEQLRALAPLWTSSDQVFIRATDVVRTHDSVLSLLVGLYPPQLRSPSLPVPRVYSLPASEEYLHPTDTCPNEREWWLATRAADPTLTSRMAQLRSAYPGVARWMDDYPPPINPWQASQVSAVADAFTSLVAHDLPLPADVPASAMPRLKEVADQDLYRPFLVSANLTRLSTGRLLDNLLGRIDAALAGMAGRRASLAVFSTHDTTVGPLLAALGAFDGKNPPFASMVSIEVLVEVADANVAHFRVQYNGRPVPLPFCPPSVSPPYTCPWPVARQFLATHRLTTAKYDQMCSSRSG